MNKITFIPTSKEVQLLVPPPKPAKLYIPEWFKEIPGINYKNIKMIGQGERHVNANIKNCIPVLDSFTSGYIQETWTDIFIEEDEDGDVEYNFSTQSCPKIMSSRDEHHMPIKNDYYDFEFIWMQVWIPKLPDGYSYLFTSPLNRPDLPFTTATAIVDGDKLNYTHGGNVPFYIKKGFSGVIHQGTPMYQMIPFKRESWKMEIEEYNEDLATKGINDLRKNFLGSYKNRYWSKKEYN
jgi:hypothetical protein